VPTQNPASFALGIPSPADAYEKVHPRGGKRVNSSPATVYYVGQILRSFFLHVSFLFRPLLKVEDIPF